MAKKYIDADKLKAEIERRIEKYRKDGFGCHANSLEHFRDDFLEPLSEEPASEDFEKEFELQFDSLPQEVLDRQSDGGIEFHDKLYAFSRHFAEWQK